MKNRGMLLLVYSIIAVLYIALSLLLTTDRGAVFWIGFTMVMFSVILTAAITMLVGKSSSAFPFELSMVTFSIAYAAVVIAVNAVFGAIFKVAVNIFISIHLLCLALYAIVMLLMFVAKSIVIKQNSRANSKIYGMQAIIYEFEKIKIKIMSMQTESRNKALPLINSLLEELRFSDAGLTVDVSDIDTRLCSMSHMLSAEVDNLILIKSEDMASMEEIISDVKKIIKERNTRIKLMSSSI